MYHRTLLKMAAVLVMAAAPLYAQSPVVFEITNEPTHPEANLVINGTLSETDNGAPAGWEFDSAVPENFEFGRAEDSYKTPGALYIKTFSPKMSGYWSQSVNVNPGDRLMVRCRMRTSGGKVLMWLTGQVDAPDGERKPFDERAQINSMRTFVLVPLWIDPDIMRGPHPDEWRVLQKIIEIPQVMTRLKISLGSYFMSGEIWFDEIYAGPAEMDLGVTVRSRAEGDAGLITRVIVKGGGQDLTDSGPLQGGVREWQTTLTGLDPGVFYVAEVRTADGGKVTELISRPEPPRY